MQQIVLGVEVGRRRAAPAVSSRLARCERRDRVEAAPALDDRRRVGDVGHDLHARPDARVARDRDRVQPEREDLSDRAGASSGITQARGTSARRSSGPSRTCRRGRRPISATAPPSGAVPDRLLWRIASAARSSPGFFPYQKPGHSLLVAPGSSPSSCVPATAVAASSSLSPGRKTMPAGRGGARARCSSRSRPAERRARVAAHEHAGVVAAAIEPPLVERQAHERLDAVEQDRSDAAVYLSSSESSRTCPPCFRSRGCLPDGIPGRLAEERASDHEALDLVVPS